MNRGARLLIPRVLKALYEISMTSNCPFKLTSERASRRDNMSYKVIIELEYENKPNVENVLEYIEELGTDLDYKLINNSNQQASEQKG
jgi:hypothetical protein